MAQKRTDEPPKSGGTRNSGTENLIGTRSQATATSQEDRYDSNFNTPSYGSMKLQRNEENEMNKEETIGFIQRVAGVDDRQASIMADAIHKWSDGYYEDIRFAQQNEDASEGFKELGKHLENYISRAAKWGGGTTYRGIRVNADLNVGDKVDMKGTSSWSTRESVAKSFAGGKTVFVSETQSKGTSIGFYHFHPLEHEVVVSKNAQYVVQKKEKVGVYTYYHVKEV